MHRSGRRLALVLVPGIILGACTSVAASPSSAPAASPSPAAVATTDPTPSPSPTPAPTPTPEPTPDLAAIGAAYVELADKARLGSHALTQRNPQTDAELREVYEEYATLFGELRTGYAALELPPEAQPAMAELLGHIDVLLEEFTALTADVNHDPGTRIADASAGIAASGARIRELLGLPPAPTVPPG